MSVLKKMVLWNVSALEPFQTALIDLKATAELIDIESDFKYFRDSVVAMADNEAQNEMVITLSDVTFEQLHITVIEEEMKRSPSYATEALHAVMSDGEDDGDEDVIPSKVPVQLSRTLDTTTTERVVTASAMRSPEKMKELTESIEPLKASEAIPVVPEQLQHSGGYELYVFGLNPADKVLETFNCALYPPSSGLMSQVRRRVCTATQPPANCLSRAVCSSHSTTWPSPVLGAWAHGTVFVSFCLLKKLSTLKKLLLWGYSPRLFKSKTRRMKSTSLDHFSIATHATPC
jgi:hypothetical protein